MADETQDSTKIPNLNQAERYWVSIKLIDLKPRDVYEPFLEAFPRLAEYADEHGISDEDLKTTIINRFCEMNKQRNLDPTEFMNNSGKPGITIFTNIAVLYDMLSVEALLKMQLEVAEASRNENLSEEELRHLEARLGLLDNNLKSGARLNKMARDKAKFDAYLKNVTERGY